MQDNKGTIITCAVTLLSVLVAELFPEPIVKVAFIAFVVLDICLYFIGCEKKRPKIKCFSYVLTAGLIVMIVVGIFSPDLPSQLLNRAVREIPEEPEKVSYMKMYQESQKNVDQSLNGLQEHVGQAEKELAELSDALKQIVPQKGTYPDEVEVLLKKFHDDQILIESKYPDIKSDTADVMLYFKRELYEQICHYSSMISAFERYGIDCANLGIDEYTLMSWDVENLYIMYSMKKSLEPDLVENPIYPSKVFNYNDYKITMNEYSDLFNYGDCCFSYENNSAQDIEDDFNDRIKGYYKRFHLNFTRGVL